MTESLCSLFAVIVALNALSSCIFCLLPYENMGFVHVVTDTVYASADVTKSLGTLSTSNACMWVLGLISWSQ